MVVRTMMTLLSLLTLNQVVVVVVVFVSAYVAVACCLYNIKLNLLNLLTLH